MWVGFRDCALAQEIWSKSCPKWLTEHILMIIFEKMKIEIVTNVRRSDGSDTHENEFLSFLGCSLSDPRLVLGFSKFPEF